MAEWLHRKMWHAGQKTLWEVVRAWGLPLPYSDAVMAGQQCTICTEKHSHWLPQDKGGLRQWDIPLTCWQVDYISPLPLSGSSHCALACVDTTTDLLQADPCQRATQRATIRGLKQLCAAYGSPDSIKSDQGTHITGHQVQEWADAFNIEWRFHLPYNPSGASLTERYNGLLKGSVRCPT